MPVKFVMPVALVPNDADTDVIVSPLVVIDIVEVTFAPPLADDIPTNLMLVVE